MVRLAYCCISCRRSWKGYGVSIASLAEFRASSTGSVHCPACGRSGLCMGQTFKPPPKNSVRQWRKIEVLVQAGKGLGNIATLTEAKKVAARAIRAAGLCGLSKSGWWRKSKDASICIGRPGHRGDCVYAPATGRGV